MSSTDTGGNWIDPDDAPELTDEWFDNAAVKLGDRIIRKGRPPGSAKAHVSIRIDRDVLEWFKAGGPGWQTRINQALRQAKGG